MSIKRTLIGALIGSCDAGIGKPSIDSASRTGHKSVDVQD